MTRAETRRTAFVRFIPALLIGAVLASLIAPGAAVAVDRGNLGTSSPSNPTISKDFPELSGQRPSTLYAHVRQPACRQESSTYCGLHTFQVDVPLDYPFIHTLRVTLTWTNNDAADPTTGSNMDLCIWANDPEGDGPPEDAALGPCFADSRVVGQHPEETKIDEIETGTYWISVYHSNSFPDGGYNLTLNWETVDLGDLPDFDLEKFRGGGIFGGGSLGGGSGGNANRGSGFGSLDSGSSSEDPQAVKVPGADGALADFILPALARGLGFRPDGSFSPIIPITILLALISIGTFVFFFLKRRKQEEEELEAIA